MTVKKELNKLEMKWNSTYKKKQCGKISKMGIEQDVNLIDQLMKILHKLLMNMKTI